MSMEKKKSHCHDDYSKLVYEDGSYECQGCKEQHFGLRYRCKEKCKSDFCQSCSVEQRKSHPFLFSEKERMTFKWKEEAPKDSENRYCIACGRKIRGFHYESEVKKHSSEKHALHPTCVHAPPEMKVDGIKFRLVEVASAKSKCIVCSESDKSYLYEFEKGGRRGHVHLVCIKRSIEEVDWRRPDNEVKVSGSEKYWKLAELLLGVFISVLSGNPIGPIGSLLAHLTIELFRGR